MELKSIKTNHCPCCNSNKVVMEFVETLGDEISTHVNGHQWEHRDFACGYGVQFIPNFNREEVKSLCRKDKRMVLLKKKEKQALEELQKIQKNYPELIFHFGVTIRHDSIK